MYNIRIVDIKEHGDSGYIEVVVRAVDKVGNTTFEGPEKTYGTDADQLNLAHKGDVMNWLMSVKQQHQAHHGMHTTAIHQLQGLKGKIL